MDLVRHRRDESDEKGGCRDLVRLLRELGEGELGCSIDGHEEVELAFSRLHLGDVDVEVADRVALELLLGGLVAIDLRQAADAVALQTAMQR